MALRGGKRQEAGKRGQDMGQDIMIGKQAGQGQREHHSFLKVESRGDDARPLSCRLGTATRTARQCRAMASMGGCQALRHHPGRLQGHLALP